MICATCKHFEAWDVLEILGECKWDGPRPAVWVIESNLIHADNAPVECRAFDDKSSAQSFVKIGPWVFPPQPIRRMTPSKITADPRNFDEG